MTFALSAQVEDDEMGRECNRHGINDKFTQNYSVT
jgi:hypothetical protein